MCTCFRAARRRSGVSFLISSRTPFVPSASSISSKHLAIFHSSFASSALKNRLIKGASWRRTREQRRAVDPLGRDLRSGAEGKEAKIGSKEELGTAGVRPRLALASVKIPCHEASRDYKRRSRVRGIVVFKTLILYEGRTAMCFFIGWREGGIKIPDL